jgi:hypothetical protein
MPAGRQDRYTIGNTRGLHRASSLEDATAEGAGSRPAVMRMVGGQAQALGFRGRSEPRPTTASQTAICSTTAVTLCDIPPRKLRMRRWPGDFVGSLLGVGSSGTLGATPRQGVSAGQRLGMEPPVGIEPTTFSLRVNAAGFTRLHSSPLTCGNALNERLYDGLEAASTATELHRAHPPDVAGVGDVAGTRRVSQALRRRFAITSWFRAFRRPTFTGSACEFRRSTQRLGLLHE